jgi:hypothetical protein
MSLTVRGNALLQSSGGRLFVVEPTATLTLQGLTLSGAEVAGDGGAIYSHGALHLEKVTLRNNSAARGGALFVGASAALTATDSILEDNSASTVGGGLYLAGRAAITDTLWSRNRAQDGGAVRVQPGAEALLDTCVLRDGHGDTAPALSNSGEARLSRCTIANMSTTGDYGAVDNDGVLRISNTIFYNNRSVDADSLHNHTITDYNLSRIELVYVTFYNRSPQGFAEIINNGEMTLLNTIVGVESGRTCYEGAKPEVTATTTSLGGNVLSDGGCFTAQASDHFSETLPAVGEDTFGNPIVFPSDSSPAIDGARCVAPNALDIRAVARPQGKSCDSGAVEVEPGEIFNRLYLPLINHPLQ